MSKIIIAINTNIAAITATTVAMIVIWLQARKPDASLTMNSTLAGPVTITTPCAFVSPTNSIIIGAVSGIITVFGIILLDRKGVVDPVGVIPVHTFCRV